MKKLARASPNRGFNLKRYDKDRVIKKLPIIKKNEKMKKAVKMRIKNFHQVLPSSLSPF